MTQPAPLNLIVGEEAFLTERARTQLIRAAQQATTDPLEVATCAAGELTAAQLMELLSPSLFGDERVVVITDAAQAGAEPAKDILAAVADIPPGIIVIIEHTGGGRQKSLVAAVKKLGAQVFTADKLKPSERPDFVRQELARHRVRVSPEVITTILDAVGSDLRELASAVSQLVADTGGAVTEAAVRSYYGQTAEVSGFDVADLVLAGRPAQATAAARRALQVGVPPVLLAAAVTSAVGDMAKVAGQSGIDPFRHAAHFGMPPWKLKKTLAAARGWSRQGIAQATQLAAELDGAVKGESADTDFAVEDAVRRIAAARRI